MVSAREVCVGVESVGVRYSVELIAIRGILLSWEDVPLLRSGIESVENRCMSASGTAR